MCSIPVLLPDCSRTVFWLQSCQPLEGTETEYIQVLLYKMGCEIPLGYRVMPSVIFSVSKAETSIAAERIVLPEALNLSILLCSIHGQDTSITQYWLRI